MNAVPIPIQTWFKLLVLIIQEVIGWEYDWQDWYLSCNGNMESPLLERKNIPSVVSSSFWENPHLYLYTNIHSVYKIITMLQSTEQKCLLYIAYLRQPVFYISISIPIFKAICNFPGCNLYRQVYALIICNTIYHFPSSSNKAGQKLCTISDWTYKSSMVFYI